MRTLLLLFLPLLAQAQPSWMNVNFVPDQYPEESSWDIVGEDGIVASGAVGDTLLFLPSGDYTFVAYDSFGDGICCAWGDGFFELHNPCGLDTAVYDFSTPMIEVPFFLPPCALPVSGCMDDEAVNYDDEATIGGVPCEYEITFRLDLNGPHPEGIITPEVNSDFFGWCGSCVAMSDPDGNGVWEVTVVMPEGQYLWKFSADNWEYEELPVGVAQSPCFLFDQFGFVNRTLNVNGPKVLPPFCWESCLPCGAIVGCTDPDAINWNPWANIDQGCNIVESANCSITETEISVVVVPDNYPEETGWTLADLSNEVIIESVLVGQLSDEPTGIPVVTNVCAPIGSQLSFTITDAFGDGLNGAQWGGEDGGFGLSACGDPLYVMDPSQANFGYQFEHQFQSPACLQVEDVVGCGDPDYLEYNPDATLFLDMLCETPVVYGCIDSNYYNYDSLANVELQPDSCFYTLTLTDGVGDGWFGSWLGVRQGEWLSPEYKMGPDDGTEEVFELYLASQEEVELYFFPTAQSMFTVAQCGFSLQGPTGDTLIDVPQWGVIPFPFTYTSETYCGNFCEEYAYGCLDTLAQNYDSLANTADSSCYYTAGCTQAGYLEYYTQGYEADFDDGSCDVLAVFGCTDSTALNYDPTANVDIGGCIPVVIGCMDIDAFNYDPEANTPDNELCLYDAGCIGEAGDPYWANDYCYLWVIEIDPYCCTTAWDSTCADLYTYCGQGVTSVVEYDRDVELYPNPTDGVLSIRCSSPCTTSVYSLSGQEVVSLHSGKTIDLSSLESGVYQVVIYHDGAITRKRIIKS
jgi:hypothetical protein